MQIFLYIVCIFISASGSSTNLLQATQTAKDLGLVTIGILGFDGGKIRHEVDYLAIVRTEIGRYGPVEDMHLAICHELAELVGEKLSFEGKDWLDESSNNWKPGIHRNTH